MINNWETCFNAVLESEGGTRLTVVPGDRGGQTYAGIARKPNPQWEGWKDIDQGLTPKLSVVKSFYKSEFWDKIKGDELPNGLDYLIYDFAVNAGVKRSVKTLQSCLGLTEDGVIGNKTLTAANNEANVMEKFNSKKGEFYLNIVANDPTQSKFIKGWLNRVEHSKSAALSMLQTVQKA